MGYAMEQVTDLLSFLAILLIADPIYLD